MFELAVMGIIGVLASYSGVALVIRWAEKYNVIDVPNDRSAHENPTPRGGGLLIFLVVSIGIAISWLRSPQWPGPVVTSYLVGAGIIALVSGIDDLRTLSNRYRFVAHSLAALCVLLFAGYWEELLLPLVGVIPLGKIGFLVSFLWIVGLTNAFNFMDGIDGIAGGQGAVAGAAWVLLGFHLDQPLLAVLGLLLVSSSLGFLGHNWPPARVFMGDIGSTFMGYTFAFMAIWGSKVHGKLAFAGVLLVWPFVFDSVFTFLRRLFSGENIFEAHRSHLYQRLINFGRTHQSVTILYLGLDLLGAVFSLLWVFKLPIGEWIAPLGLAAAGVGLWVYVSRFVERLPASQG